MAPWGQIAALQWRRRRPNIGHRAKDAKGAKGGSGNGSLGGLGDLGASPKVTALASRSRLSLWSNSLLLVDISLEMAVGVWGLAANSSVARSPRCCGDKSPPYNGAVAVQILVIAPRTPRAPRGITRQSRSDALLVAVDFSPRNIHPLRGRRAATFALQAGWSSMQTSLRDGVIRMRYRGLKSTATGRASLRDSLVPKWRLGTRAKTYPSRNPSESGGAPPHSKTLSRGPYPKPISEWNWVRGRLVFDMAAALRLCWRMPCEAAA